MTNEFSICSVAGEDVKAAAMFEYKGFNISMSTIMRMARPVAVFKDNMLKREFETVQQALAWADREAAPPMPTMQLMRLRALRLWHWQGNGYRRKAQEFYESQANPSAAHHAEWHKDQADFHLGQVQLLNEFFPLGDTAEKDAQK